MNCIKLPNLNANINLNDGVILNGQKLAGTVNIDQEQKQLTFTQNAKKVKSAPKNPITFGGDYMSVRLHQGTGASQLTMRLSANTDIQTIRGALINEFVEAIESIGN